MQCSGPGSGNPSIVSGINLEARWDSPGVSENKGWRAHPGVTAFAACDQCNICGHTVNLGHVASRGKPTLGTTGPRPDVKNALTTACCLSLNCGPRATAALCKQGTVRLPNITRSGGSG